MVECFHVIVVYLKTQYPMRSVLTSHNNFVLTGLNCILGWAVGAAGASERHKPAVMFSFYTWH